MFICKSVAYKYAYMHKCMYVCLCIKHVLVSIMTLIWSHVVYNQMEKGVWIGAGEREGCLYICVYGFRSHVRTNTFISLFICILNSYTILNFALKCCWVLRLILIVKGFYKLAFIDRKIKKMYITQ